MPAQDQLGQHQAGAQVAIVVGLLEPAGHRALALHRHLERNMVADQLARASAILLCGTVEPVQGGRQAFGQARAAEQIQGAQVKLGLGAACARATDER
ncbi:hypothetical protein [Massilia aquatica]|uniref:hypothetical protein n=1 Tax=Massilia aquatica TaxID=2609000 RepID=UPI002805CB96|nr:hypothetical protein [Massilia aquatica]